MAGMEGIIRPFAEKDVTPLRIYQSGARSVAPVRLAIGAVGGTKTFSFSGSASMSSRMAAVHTERTTPIFDMTIGDLARE